MSKFIPNIKNDEKQIGNYVIKNIIRSEGYTAIVKAIHKPTDEKVTIKIIDKNELNKSQTAKKSIEKEISILKILNHKNIIKLYEIIETTKKIYLVTEYCDGGDLFEYIIKLHQLTQEQSCIIFQQLIESLEYLHSQNICHRNLKLENIFLSKPKNGLNINIKLADFSMSTFYTLEKLLSTPCGTVSYTAPEILKGEDYYGLLSDIWSSGIILYIMNFGYLPFHEENNEDNITKIINGKLEFPENANPDLVDLLKHILDINILTRYDLEQIKNHPWYNIYPVLTLKPGLIIGYHKIPIDNNIVNECELMGYNKLKVKQSIIDNKFDSNYAIYYILLNKKINEGFKSISDLKSEVYLNYIKTENNLIKNSNENKGNEGSNKINKSENKNRKGRKIKSKKIYNNEKITIVDQMLKMDSRNMIKENFTNPVIIDNNNNFINNFINTSSFNNKLNNGNNVSLELKTNRPEDNSIKTKYMKNILLEKINNIKNYNSSLGNTENSISLNDMSDISFRVKLADGKREKILKLKKNINNNSKRKMTEESYETKSKKLSVSYSPFEPQSQRQENSISSFRKKLNNKDNDSSLTPVLQNSKRVFNNNITFKKNDNMTKIEYLWVLCDRINKKHSFDNELTEDYSSNCNKSENNVTIKNNNSKINKEHNENYAISLRKNNKLSKTLDISINKESGKNKSFVAKRKKNELFNTKTSMNKNNSVTKKNNTYNNKNESFRNKQNSINKTQIPNNKKNENVIKNLKNVKKNSIIAKQSKTIDIPSKTYTKNRDVIGRNYIKNNNTTTKKTSIKRSNEQKTEKNSHTKYENQKETPNFIINKNKNKNKNNLNKFSFKLNNTTDTNNNSNSLNPNKKNFPSPDQTTVQFYKKLPNKKVKENDTNNNNEKRLFQKKFLLRGKAKTTSNTALFSPVCEFSNKKSKNKNDDKERKANTSIKKTEKKVFNIKDKPTDLKKYKGLVDIKCVLVAENINKLLENIFINFYKNKVNHLRIDSFKYRCYSEKDNFDFQLYNLDKEIENHKLFYITFMGEKRKSIEQEGMIKQIIFNNGPSSFINK